MCEVQNQLCIHIFRSSQTSRHEFFNNDEKRTITCGCNEFLSPEKSNTVRQITERCRALSQKQGAHSNIAMNSAGFHYTDNENAACCDTCELEVSGWRTDMRPFAIHKQRSPNCRYVLSILPLQERTITSSSNIEEPSCKRLKTDATDTNLLLNKLFEVNILKQVRKRTFSHWPHRSSPSSSQMIEAGFFNCNVGDRVICIYCNIICQQWTPNTDDPCEVHKTLSPKCPYVLAMSAPSQTSSMMIINEHLTSDPPSDSEDANSFRSHALVYTTSCNINYIEIRKRYASFATWPNENLPPVDDLVKAGFFFTGTKTIVTCFHCNGSLKNWGPNDNPMIEHARWFPNCAYAKQLCGADLHRKIQELKREQQG